MAKVVVGRHARHEFERLDWVLSDAIWEAVLMLGYEPFAGGALRGRFLGLRSLRVGVYRVIYELRDGDKTVRVLAVRHRSVAYDSDPR
ncbi:MAG: type II toxin-antitoxin system RelE family toxin [Solirubrobacterales bacterium]